MVFEVDVDGLADVLLTEIALKIFAKSQENLVEMKAVDTGFLLKSGWVDVDGPVKELGYSAAYAGFVEFGRNPGSMPPVGAIRAWAKRKLGLSPKKAERAAWAIARAIEERGIQPRPFLRSAIDSVLGGARARVRVE